MKILLLTERFGDKIPTGVLSRRMAEELRNLGNEIAVISSPRIGARWPYGPHVICKVLKVVPGRVLIFISNVLGLNVDSFRWRNKMYRKSLRLVKSFKPDVIYARSTPISVCEVAIRLKEKTGNKVMLHFTDPVPAPIEWDNNIGYRKRMIATMDKVLKEADVVSFGNSAMLKYQQSIQTVEFSNKSFISPDSGSFSHMFHGESNDKDKVTLVYLGSLYGNRNPYPLFEAITQLNGSKERYIMKIYDINRVNTQCPESVKFVGRTDDIRSALLGADILVNIDGDDKEPVFISSKIKEYLCCGRPIISITPRLSPTRNMTKELKTVISVENNTEEIKTAIENIISERYIESDFEERIPIIKSYSPEIVAADINDRMQKITKQ